MLILLSLGALVSAHALPGLLIVKLLDIGRDREERWVLAAVLGLSLSVGTLAEPLPPHPADWRFSARSAQEVHGHYAKRVEDLARELQASLEVGAQAAIQK